MTPLGESFSASWKSLEICENQGLDSGAAGVGVFVEPFEYRRARSVEEATAVLREHGGRARPLAGGQSLVPMLNLGLVQPDVLVDIGGIAELRGVSRQDGTLAVGAVTRYRDLEGDPLISGELPVLAEAVRHVGNARVRNRGTLGGSLAHSDPAAELPAVMLALDATYEISDGRAVRTLPASAFHTGLFETALGEGELLTRVLLPVPGPGWGWGFAELARRAGDFAIVAAVALARCRDGAVEAVRLALAGAADRPLRCAAFERAAVGLPVDDLERAAAEIGGEVDPLEDLAASRPYRRRVAPVVALRAVRDACRRSPGGPGR